MRTATIPLEFTFIYRPDQGFAPIHEVTEGRNRRIKAFYWRLWFDQNQALPEGIDLHDELVGPKVTITAAAIERNLTVEAPMDFAIVTGWQVCCSGFRDYALLRILMQKYSFS
jgi:fatty acid synthase subunit alpha, fungi type